MNETVIYYVQSNGLMVYAKSKETLTFVMESLRLDGKIMPMRTASESYAKDYLLRVLDRILKPNIDREEYMYKIINSKWEECNGFDLDYTITKEDTLRGNNAVVYIDPVLLTH